MLTLGGTMIAHRAVEYDYCLKAALMSLMDVCDEVVVVATEESHDGTHDLLAKLRTDKLKVIHRQWVPSSKGKWLADLTNEARLSLSTEMHLSLQADEVLHHDDYPLLRQMASTKDVYRLNRINFWYDHRHQLPPEVKVGSRIIRMAPVNVPSGGDAQALDWPYACSSNARIFHYGFIRRAQALSAKGRPFVKAINGGEDPLWDDVDARGAPALIDAKNATAVTLDQLLPFVGTHPVRAHEWLTDHRFKV
jgi:septum formation topological specificity factor MinE